MFFIGDVHGKVKTYFKLIKNLPQSIQVGDFGLGFKGVPRGHFCDWGENHKFIRGNHDDPTVCREHPNYLGDYGITDDGIFFVSGGFSIDYEWRQAHNWLHPDEQIWWNDEEIEEKHFPKILELFETTKPEIVVAHDAPEFVKAFIVDGNIEDKRRYINRTSDGLMPAMIEVHKPKLWVFGHYHTSVDTIIDGVQYKGLDELEIFEYGNNGSMV